MSIIGLFFAGTLALLFVSAAVAPLESLGWYAGWFGEKEEEEPQELLTPDPAGEISPASHYLVYLSGIGAIAPNSIPSEELPFIAGLQQKLPDSLVLTDVFPYSVTNLGLTGQRVTARVWRWIEQLRLKNPMAVAAFLINLRNVFLWLHPPTAGTAHLIWAWRRKYATAWCATATRSTTARP